MQNARDAADREYEAKQAERQRQLEAHKAEEKRQREAREAEERRQRQAREAEARRQREARIAEARKHQKTPATHSVLGDKSILAFDGESLIWSLENLSNFFDHMSVLATVNERPNYSLAIRKWPSSDNVPESSLPLPQGVDWDDNLAFAEIEKTVEEDFGKDVVCSVHHAALLLRSGHEDLGRGVYLFPGEKLGFSHVRWFVSLFQIGRRLNTCIYTLCSLDGDINAKKSLAMTLKENQQQKVSIFENTIRASVLRGIALYKETLSTSGEVTY
jgi:flagellar biosynthesis GTPase FlhF